MAYGTNVDLTTYLTDNGYTVPVGYDPDVARLKGSNYVDGTYYSEFKGTAVGLDAAWPRTGVTGVSSAVVPLRVEHATYEAAILWANDAAALTSGAVISTQQVKREKVDVIEVEYQDNVSDTIDLVDDAIPRYSVIESLLRPLLRVKGFTASALVV